MFDWLRDKLTSFTTRDAAAQQLCAQFTPVEKLNNAPANIAQRVARFVLTGEDESVLADLSSLTHSSMVLGMSSNYFAGGKGRLGQSLYELVKVLPLDVDIYQRLANTYLAARTAGTPNSFLYDASIPAFQGIANWLSTFLSELSQSGTLREPILPVELIQQMLTKAELPPDLLVRGAFFFDDATGKSQLSKWLNRPFKHFHCLKGFSELVIAGADVVRPAFSQKDASSRACALQALGALKIPLETFKDEITTLSVSSSKEVREQAELLMADDFERFREPLEQLAINGKGDQRYHAVRLLARHGGSKERTFLENRLSGEKSAKVIELLREQLEQSSVGAKSTQTVESKLAPMPTIELVAPLDKEVLKDLRECFAEFEKKAAEEFSRSKYVLSRNLTRTPIAKDTAERFYAALETISASDQSSWPSLEHSAFYHEANKTLTRFAAHPKFDLIHLVRWCLLTAPRQLRSLDQPLTLQYSWREPFLSYQKSRKQPIDLRELAAVFSALGFDARTIGQSLLHETPYLRSPLLQSDPDRIWPYFQEQPELLEEALGLKQVANPGLRVSFGEQHKREHAFGILKLFPEPPARFLPLLWEIALGASKSERPLAQTCLARLPDKEQKIIAALASRQQESRLAAAQWLAELNCQAAIPALRTALKKEKSEPVKDELMRALETLGVKLEELVDVTALDQQAAKGLQKGIPSDLDWFPFVQLPTVRWADSGQEVPPTLIKWFLVQGFKLRTAEANPTLRRYGALINKGDRERLGRFIVEAWIAADTKPKYSSEQAAAEAQRLAQQAASYARQFPKYFPDFDEQRTYQTNFNRLVTLPEGSQTSTKGILAMAGACCGGDVGPIVHRYVRQWYGYRGAQSKALLQVLAWIDDPRATQVVLAIANRFRTKGIQEEAMRQCQLLANRKGWSLDELADRTIPTAGFDEDARAELDYGSRKFVASLSEDFTISISNDSGKTIAALPDANQSDDPEKVKEAKASLSASRKELKSILTMQKDRLYESLCTQRPWTVEDWTTYLSKHPIVGRYCQRLVWIAWQDDRAVESFRPLGDGTLTNHQDEEVTLAANQLIRLAHDETLPTVDRNSWLQHFSDYKVEPLFQQFGKQTFAITGDLKEGTEIKEFLGYLTKAFSLRNRLTRLGYTRGSAQDGGWFFDYRKTFPGLGLDAIIEFTGNSLPEENRTVALQRLYFVRRFGGDDSGMTEEMILGELPRVLVSECWNDIRMAAADGSGYSADWQKQTDI